MVAVISALCTVCLNFFVCGVTISLGSGAYDGVIGSPVCSLSRWQAVESCAAKEAKLR